ncbi:MAG TPA: polymer-forming cytoskeletal protein, partial [Rhizomicrobium sp.]|nr:polymer-forming cytoskeletal protein [Rhizomicrobium sp.]
MLGPGVTVQGVLEIDGELVVAGHVRGRIAAVKVVIAAPGSVEGDIVAREVVIAGRLNGRVFAPNVSIEASADVEGRIFHT